MPRFRVFLQDGSDLPDFVTAETRWEPGDTVMFNPAMQFRVTAVVPGDEFSGDEYDALLERRLLGELSTELSTEVGEPEAISDGPRDATMRPRTSQT
jgi:hypothetical protein